MKTLDKFRKDLNEGVIVTADYKVGTDGRKYRAHRFSLNKNDESNTEIQTESSLNLPKDPPFVLVLKREGIRYYHNNTKVALYYNAKLDKHFSVPYGPDISSPVVQSEEFEQLEEHVMDTLHKIHNEKQAQRVKFADCTTRKIDEQIATAIISLHEELNTENKQKLLNMINESPAHLMKAAELAFKHVK